MDSILYVSEDGCPLGHTSYFAHRKSHADPAGWQCTVPGCPGVAHVCRECGGAVDGECVDCGAEELLS